MSNKKYKILQNSDIEELVDMVNDHIDKGYDPVGAPFTFSGGFGIIINQAMIFTHKVTSKIPEKMQK
jgi:hypothetical protein